jgi:hypothetical protein
VKSSLLADFLQAPNLIFKNWWVMLLVHWEREEQNITSEELKLPS